MPRHCSRNFNTGTCNTSDFAIRHHLPRADLRSTTAQRSGTPSCTAARPTPASLHHHSTKSSRSRTADLVRVSGTISCRGPRAAWGQELHSPHHIISVYRFTGCHPDCRARAENDDSIVPLERLFHARHSRSCHAQHQIRANAERRTSASGSTGQGFVISRPAPHWPSPMCGSQNTRGVRAQSPCHVQ